MDQLQQCSNFKARINALIKAGIAKTCRCTRTARGASELFLKSAGAQRLQVLRSTRITRTARGASELLQKLAEALGALVSYY